MYLFLHLSNFLSFLIIIMFLYQVPMSLCSSNEQYLNCSSSFDCANLHNLSYPFWGSHRPDYCGHPAFKLECCGEVAEITIRSESYRVLEVSDSTHILNIVSTDFWNNTCPTYLRNNNIDCAVFDYGSNSKNLTIYYDCPSPPFSFQRGFPTQFNCSINSTEMVNYFMLESIPENAETSFSVSGYMETCKSEVFVPILESQAKVVEANSNLENLKAALSSGFELEWDANNSLCHDCQNSGGHCGYNPSSGEFICHCKVGSFHSKCQSGNISKSTIIGIAVGVAGFVGILLGILLFLVLRRRKRIAEESKSKELFVPPSSGDGNTSTTNMSQSVPSYATSNVGSVQKSFYYGVQVFTYPELEEATDNFSPSKELGDGGFGTVYYGKLKDGRAVAVKRLYESNFKRVEQFMNEVQILAKIRHDNLVALYGCTSRHSRELLLVYEYIPNGTIADHVHGKRAKSVILPWPIRLNIAVETAQALAYLHASDVIHRDVKTNNILLDNNFRVKVADFGLSRLFPNDVTHVSTAPQGTPGYVDPEYYQCYQLTDKSDVYSFGVVLIELISSLEAVDVNRTRLDVNLANMAINKIQTQELEELVDPYLGFERDPAIRMMITSVAELAFRCLQQDRDMRPSMDEVLNVLKGIQDEEYGQQDSEVVDIRRDEVIPLKNVPLPFSPDSVADNWVSRSTTSNSS